MKYFYRCKECKLRDLDPEMVEADEHNFALQERFMRFTEEGELDLKETAIVWEVSHGMTESPDVPCPVCEESAVRIITGGSAFYFRGNGYLDKDGCRRDMNLYKLLKDDPYGHMRQPGEKDDLIAKLKNRGKHNPNRKIYVPSKSGGYHRKD